MKRPSVKKTCHWFMLKPWVKISWHCPFKGLSGIKMNIEPCDLCYQVSLQKGCLLLCHWFIYTENNRTANKSTHVTMGEILKRRCGNDRRSVVWLRRRSLWVRRRRWLRLPRLQLLQALPRDSHRPSPNHSGWNRQIPLSDIIEI